MSVQAATAHATAAATAITQSSGATATLAASAGQLIYLQRVIILHGAALLTLVTGDLTLSGLAMGTLSIPIGQLLSQTNDLVLDFATPGSNGQPASAANTAVSLSIPALTGGAETTLVLIGVYF